MIYLYKTKHCPMCQLLASKLEEKHIEYLPIEDPKILQEKHITYVPILEVDNQLLSFQQALKWVNEQS